jgi:hypothetical protein
MPASVAELETIPERQFLDIVGQSLRRRHSSALDEHGSDGDVADQRDGDLLAQVITGSSRRRLPA